MSASFLTHPPPASLQPLPRLPSTHTPRDIVLPPWQPDEGVSHCPICASRFTWLLRKHHCRKCGRVVCANCSPHRITIPRQYIIRTPTEAAQQQQQQQAIGPHVVDLTDADDRRSPLGLTLQPLALSPALGGGETVRLCNPCVPDPQPPPPPPPHEHLHRHRHSSPLLPHEAIFDQQEAAGRRVVEQERGSVARAHRRATHHSQQPTPRLLVSPTVEQAQHLQSGTGLDARQRIESDLATPRPLPPPPNSRPGRTLPIRPRSPSAPGPSSTGRHHYRASLPTHGLSSPSASASTSAGGAARHSHYRSMLDIFPLEHETPTHPAAHPQPSTAAPAAPAAPAVAATYDDEDFCPVCSIRLPARGPDGDTTAREAHVDACIHDTVSSSSFSPSSSSFQPSLSSSHDLPPASSNLQTGNTPNTHPAGASPIAAAATPSSARSLPRHSHSHSHSHHHHHPNHALRPEMVKYTATEKDCMDAEGAPVECSICFCEYEVGEAIGRLFCWCKFHYACIAEWWERAGRGRCPVHHSEQ